MKKKPFFFFLTALLWAGVVSAQNGLVQGYFPQGPTYVSDREDLPNANNKSLLLTFTRGQEIKQLGALLDKVHSLSLGARGKEAPIAATGWYQYGSDSLKIIYAFTQRRDLYLYLHLSRVQANTYNGYWHMGEEGTPMPVEFSFDRLYPTAYKNVFSAQGGSKDAALILYFQEDIFLKATSEEKAPKKKGKN